MGGRSVFGWSLPPGVTTSMLPGNSPEDEAYEDWVEDLITVMAEGINFAVDKKGLKVLIDEYWEEAKDEADEMMEQQMEQEADWAELQRVRDDEGKRD